MKPLIDPADSPLDRGDAFKGPRSRRAADDLALRIYDWMRGRPAGERRMVYAALVAADHEGEASTERVVVALRSLEACLADEGKLSYEGYRKWREGQGHPEEWLSAKRIRMVFKSWKKAREALGVDVPLDPSSVSLMSFGSTFARDELIEALRVSGERAGEALLTPHRYVELARQINKERSRHGEPPNGRRLPATIAPFMREFGTWPRARTAAGLQAATQGFEQGRRAPDSEYTDKRLLDCLQRAWEDSPGIRLSGAAYDAWAARQAEQARCRGEWEVFPRRRTMSARFGSWPDALIAAGVITESGRDLYLKTGPKLSDEQLLAWLRKAYSELPLSGTAERPDPRRLTQVYYASWRRRATRGHGVKSSSRLIPGVDAIRRRFGGFSAAVERMLEETSSTAKNVDHVALGSERRND